MLGMTCIVRIVCIHCKVNERHLPPARCTNKNNPLPALSFTRSQTASPFTPAAPKFFLPTRGLWMPRTNNQSADTLSVLDPLLVQLARQIEPDPDPESGCPAQSQHLRSRDSRHGILLLVHLRKRGKGWESRNGRWTISDVVKHLRSLALRAAAKEPVRSASGCGSDRRLVRADHASTAHSELAADEGAARSILRNASRPTPEARQGPDLTDEKGEVRPAARASAPSATMRRRWPPRRNLRRGFQCQGATLAALSSIRGGPSPL